LHEAGVIQLDPESQYHSQVLPAPKSDGTWRFCIDLPVLEGCDVANTGHRASCQAVGKREIRVLRVVRYV
jgi:hypothetical protein